ncbi:uroporphyrinogen-III synthase [Psychromonas sp. CNPT3]|uniref:uroporphyrinogen-III synthase n=1 Tax=Psychromonas sp. CNPT3 TaxID=314282 RepID=UPI00006E706E|nr:uroporphyrinogen-III synthase [Psychromonas sp. CNPT3]
MLKPRLLITRFEPHASRLVKLLNEQGVFSLAQPLLEVQSSAECHDVDLIFVTRYDYIIAISAAAVKYTEQALDKKAWPTATFIAVGKRTQKMLQQATQKEVQCPPLQHDTQGLLALACLNCVQGKKILILRGVGGRAKLKKTLESRGAEVSYYQPYQRVVIDLNMDELVENWQLHKINGAIISSIELLENFTTRVRDKHWLYELHLYVPSQRILDRALQLGWVKIVLLASLADQQIIDHFK